MATLNSFGFSVRKANAPHKEITDVKKPAQSKTKPSVASSTLANKSRAATMTKRKPLTTTSTRQQTTLTRFLTPQTRPDTDNKIDTSANTTNKVHDDQDHTICVIRRRIPIMDIWTDILSEFEDPLNDDDDDDNLPQEKDSAVAKTMDDEANDVCLIGRGRRRMHDDNDDEGARPKRANTIDLTSVFQQFMSLQLPLARLKPVPYTSVFDEYEPDEDLSRTVRQRMTVAEANALLTRIVDEFVSYPSVL